MLQKPRTKMEVFQLYKLAMLQRALNANDISLAKDDSYRNDGYKGDGKQPLSSPARQSRLQSISKFETAMKNEVTKMLAESKEIVPQTHSINLLLKDTKRGSVSSALTRLERYLDNAVKTHGVPKSAFSLYTYRDEIESALKGDNRYAIRLKFAGTDATQKAAFEFVKNAMDEPDFQVEPTKLGHFGVSLKPFFESGSTLAEARENSGNASGPFERVPLVFPYTPGPHTVDHELFMAESLKPLYDWELIEDNQRETEFFIEEYSREYGPLYEKWALQEFSDQSEKSRESAGLEA